jgi:hypothetical protein
VRTTLQAALLLVLAAGHVAGSAQTWHLETRFGRVRPDSAPADAEDSLPETLKNVMAGVRYDSPLAGFQVSTGLPTEPEQPLWGAMSGWGRVLPFRSRGLFAGLDLAGSGFLLRDRRSVPGGIGGGEPLSRENGYGVSGQALPVIGYQGDWIGAEARTGVSHYRSRLGSVERDHTVWLTEAQTLVSPVSWLAAGPVVRHYRAEGRDDSYAGGRIVLSYLDVGAWAFLGEWVGRSEPGVRWAAGMSVRPHPRFRISAGYRDDGFDPLYLREAQTSWSFGVSWQIGGPVAPRRSEYESGLVDADGEVTIRLGASETSSPPRVAGDFNDWRPVPMTRSGDGWAHALSLPSGVYHYAFVDADGVWFVPESAPGRRSDGMGGYVAVLVVP